MIFGKGAYQLLPLDDATLNILSLDLEIDHVHNGFRQTLIGLRIEELVQQSPSLTPITLCTQYHCICSPSRVID